MIEQCEPGAQSAKLADEYLSLVERNESALVVSQTRAEVRAVNDAVRTALIARGKLGRAEHTIVALEAVDLTNAQKCDARYYPADALAVLIGKAEGCRQEAPDGWLRSQLGESL